MPNLDGDGNAVPGGSGTGGTTSNPIANIKKIEYTSFIPVYAFSSKYPPCNKI